MSSINNNIKGDKIDKIKISDDLKYNLSNANNVSNNGNKSSIVGNNQSLVVGNNSSVSNVNNNPVHP